MSSWTSVWSPSTILRGPRRSGHVDERDNFARRGPHLGRAERLAPHVKEVPERDYEFRRQLKVDHPGPIFTDLVQPADIAA
jgi:hypothetical protein